ncbi:MAG TPA: hypothetical protein PKU78_06325, partial [Candidatus Dojkabacteria bacterium]|nr:hypothetical protein [Candidatus Dojkabacteria bacterium]
FHREFLKDIRFDTEFVNAWEHVDLEYQGVMKGFLPAFRMFVSPMGLEKYIRVHDNGRSTILDQPEHQERIKQGYEYWKNKWGVEIKDLHPISMEQFVKNTKKIREAYGRH